MNDNTKYQDDFQTPTGVSVGQGPSQSGYNDTYYEQSYNDNKYNEYEEPKKKFPWKIIIIVILALLFVFLFWFFLLGGGGGKSGNAAYEKLTSDLCEKALEYERANEGIIDRTTPGATAYIRIQNLVDSYLWDSKPIKDPRYRGSLFSKGDYKEYISFDSYLRLSVASNGEPYCEGFVDTSDDHNKPIISLKGTTPMIIAKGTNFEDPGARATDDVDGDITDKIVRSGTVDISTPGEYKITYTVSDTSGNTSTVVRTIIVEEYVDMEVTLGSHFDTITPVIELKGNNPYCMEFGTKYKEPGAIATDNVDGNITDKIIVDSSKVTGNRLGNFRVTYTVSDTFGHKAIAYRSVMVKEKCTNDDVVVKPVNNRPVISVNGQSSITINLGENYRDLGATAWDKEDGDITHKIRTTNKVNTSIAQIYTVTYSVTDSGGLTATAKRIVTVKDPRANSNVATFVGGCPGNIRIPLGKEQAVPVPKAKDSNGKDVPVRTVLKDSSGANVTSGKINYYRVNVYTTEYYAKPTNGVEQLCSRTVTIYDDVAPTITSPNPMFLPVRTNHCDIKEQDLISAGLVVSDAPNEVKPVVTLTGGENKMCAVDTNGFEITVTAKDTSGNTTTKKIKVYVVDGDDNNVQGVVIGNCGTNKETLMYVGDKLNLIPHVFPVNAEDTSVSWNSVLSQYATVTQEGLVTAVAPGSTDVVVTTTSGGHKAVCKIVVKERTQAVPVTGVTISGCESGTLHLKRNTSKTLTAVVTPTNASNKAVKWVSSNTNIATISASGVVKGVALGESIIKVTTTDGNKSKECKVIVGEFEVDNTAPTDIVVYSNNANSEDPYNSSGKWMGGNIGRELKIKVKAVEPDSSIVRMEMYGSDGKLIHKVGTIPGIAGEPLGTQHAEFIIKEDINDKVYFVAINEAGLTSEKTKLVIAKLDNTGPTTTFKNWIEDPNKWVSEPSVKVTYTSQDGTGSGVVSYEYTHDDVKAKDAKDIKIEGTTNEVEMTFLEGNINKFVYVRAVDELGNPGTWTQKPSYLNMDTVAPLPPELRVESNNTSNVKIYFTFKDGVSTKPSGFGKYEYSLDNGTTVIKTTEKEPEIFKTAGTYTLEAWSFDKAGNKSASSKTTNFKVVKSSGGGGSGTSSCDSEAYLKTLGVKLSGAESAKIGETVILKVEVIGDAAKCGYKIKCQRGPGTILVSESNTQCVIKIDSFPDPTLSEILPPEETSISARLVKSSGEAVLRYNDKGVKEAIAGYHRITITEDLDKYKRYKYKMEDRKTGKVTYSIEKYLTAEAARSACIANVPKVPSGTCKAAISISSLRFKYIYTDAFTQKTESSEYIYGSLQSVLDACNKKVSQVSSAICKTEKVN